MLYFENLKVKSVLFFYLLPLLTHEKSYHILPLKIFNKAAKKGFKAFFLERTDRFAVIVEIFVGYQVFFLFL